MKGIENGEFNLVEVKTGNDELGKLRDGYNIMIMEIQNLIRKIVEEQKTKRKAELDILQAQIKPHFLYNTFDAISSLALSGRNKEVYIVMKALGNYYRKSLSKGSEVITIEEEIDIARNYLIIQKVRYGDMFDVSYECDEKIMKYKTLKLVLQPLVENALYNGIKPKGDRGHIRIAAHQEDGFIKLVVQDNGVGMENGDGFSINLNNRFDKQGSFGLKGTIERLRIFYGIDDIFKIDSKIGNGTRITISIPMEVGINYAE